MNNWHLNLWNSQHDGEIQLLLDVKSIFDVILAIQSLLHKLSTHLWKTLIFLMVWGHLQHYYMFTLFIQKT